MSGGKKESFGRKTWDKEEYLQKARDRLSQKDTVSTTKVSKYDFHQNREEQFRKVKNMSTTLVSQDQSAQTGKRGKGIGFYCEYCDLTFKNDLELVDHLNSKQHFSNANVDYVDNKEVTLEMVKDHLEKVALLKLKKLLETDQSFDLNKRIELKREFDAKMIQKRKLKKEKRRVKLKEAVTDTDTDMTKMMGFLGFSSTKN